MIEIDEIISNAEFCANEYKKFSEIAPERSLTFKKYEEDHRQLAEWLKDYKRLKEQEPKVGWIPVSERLPEDETDVLVCNKDGKIELTSGSRSTEVDDFIWYTSGWRFGDVVAWMSLPAPYEPQEWREIENDT